MIQYQVHFGSFSLVFRVKWNRNFISSVVHLLEVHSVSCKHLADFLSSNFGESRANFSRRMNRRPEVVDRPRLFFRRGFSKTSAVIRIDPLHFDASQSRGGRYYSHSRDNKAIQKVHIRSTGANSYMYISVLFRLFNLYPVYFYFVSISKHSFDLFLIFSRRDIFFSGNSFYIYVVKVDLNIIFAKSIIRIIRVRVSGISKCEKFIKNLSRNLR